MQTPTPLERVRRWVRRVFFWLPPKDEEQTLDMRHDHHLVIAVTAPERVPRLRQLRYALRVFSTGEQRTITIATIVGILALGIAAAGFARTRMVNVPVVGGSVTEALVGEPKFLNPLDAPLNNVDGDISGLIYSGLFRMDGRTAAPDLADSYTWSDDRKVLIVKLRTGALFHDGVDVTAEDVRFTYDSLQDPDRKSPLAPLYRGVTVSVDDAQTVRFTLDKPDAAFLTKLTVGILPAHLWQDVTSANARLSDLNLKPIGSGPYRVKSFLRDNLGNLHSYTLERFDRYAGVRPYLSTIIFQFYPDQRSALDAFKSDLVESIAFVNDADAAKSGTSVRAHDVKIDLPEETVAFFNMKDTLLSDKNIRQALALAVDRSDAIASLGGAAAAITGPYPFGAVTTTTPDLARARDLLTAAGWVLPQNGNVRIWAPPKKIAPPVTNSKTSKKPASAVTPQAAATTTEILATPSSTELTITISVADEPDLLATADVLKRAWSLIGVRVTVKPLPTDELMRIATRERTEQVVLLNVFLGPEQDLTPFWWSGQAVDRGLNISGLKDRNVDDALDAVRNATSTDALDVARGIAAIAITKQVPAVFLVRPTHHYLVSSSIQGVATTLTLSRPTDRLLDMLHWYVKTGWRWK